MMRIAYQWIRRLLRLRSSPTGISNLPTEIILEVASYLDAVSSTSLALTCRRLYTVSFPKRLIIQGSERELLLLLLERDLPSFYFCQFCVKLHDWHGPWKSTPWPSGRFGLCGPEMSRHIVDLEPHFIAYPFARLVVNRHLYGPEHGPDLHHLNCQSKKESIENGTVQHTSRSARIVEGQLLIYTSMSLSHCRGDSQLLRQYLDSWRPIVCVHLRLGRPNTLIHGSVQLPELVHEEGASSIFTLCHNAQGSCVFCLTDYIIEVTWQGERMGYRISLTTYRQPGDCRSPLDWGWRTMADRYIGNLPLRSTRYGTGYVRNQWNKIDGVGEGAVGKWAQPAPG
jgi:hypothetical protein